MARLHRGEQAAGKPTELDKGSWSGALKRTAREFKDDDLADRAGALTYFGILSIFPAILASCPSWAWSAHRRPSP